MRSGFKSRFGAGIPLHASGIRSLQHAKKTQRVNASRATTGSVAALSTYDPAAIGSGNVLSNNNRTVTNVSGVEWVSVRGTLARTTGKYYAEFTWTTAASNMMIGVVTAPWGLGYVGSDQYSIGQYQGNPYTYYNGVLTSSGISWSATAGIVIRLAVDLGARRFWIGTPDGNWTQSGNPNSGSGGYDFSAASSIVGNPVYIGTSVYPSNAVTLNVGDAPFFYSIPTGFQMWG